MNRSEKEAAIQALHEKMAKATFAVAVSYTKLDANTSIELRKAMRNAKIDYKVVKNTLALRAAKGTAVEPISDHFEGPVAVALGYGDVVSDAKAVHEFFKKNTEKLAVKGAVVEGKVIDATGVAALASLPGLPELRAQFLALVNTPATTLARLLNTPGGQIARVLQARVDAAGEQAA